MNPTYRTLKCFTAPEKEEAWLEGMARNGWRLSRVSGFYIYTFEKAAPEPRAYKIDYRSFKRPADREDYLILFRDSGWQPVMDKEVNGAFYFIAPGDGARRDIFSDAVSRAQRDLRFARMSFFSLFPAFLPLLTLYLTGVYRVGDVGYLTPGLWQMTGSKFLFHFLFETPFVVLRAGAFILLLIPLGMVLYFLVRYYLSYRQAGSQQMV